MKNLIVLAIVSVLTIWVVVDCNKYGDELVKKAAESPAPPMPPMVTLSDLTQVKGEYHLYITGVIKNNCDLPLRSLTILFSVYDLDDHKVGEASDWIGSLGPGESWKFKADSSVPDGIARLDGIGCDNGRLSYNFVDTKEQKRQLQKEVQKQVQREVIEAHNVAVEQQKKKQELQAIKTFQFYRVKAETGDGFSQSRLADLYFNGQGTDTNVDLARYWLYRAATNGTPGAADRLRSLAQSKP